MDSGLFFALLETLKNAIRWPWPFDGRDEHLGYEFEESLAWAVAVALGQHPVCHLLRSGPLHDPRTRPH